MKRFSMCLLIAFSAVTLIFAGGNKQIDTEYTPEEQKIVDMYRIWDKDYDPAPLDVMRDLSETYFYGAPVDMWQNNPNPGKGVVPGGAYRDAYSNPGRTQIIIDEFRDALRYPNIAERFDIESFEYKHWLETTMEADALALVDSLDSSCRLGLFLDNSKAGSGIWESKLFMNPEIGFESKLRQLYDSVGTYTSSIVNDIVLDVSSYGQALLDMMELKLFEFDDFSRMLSDRMENDIAVYRKAVGTIPANVSGGIAKIRGQVGALSEHLWHEQEFRKNYKDIYMSDLPIQKGGRIEDRSWGFGLRAGLGHVGLTGSFFSGHTAYNLGLNFCYDILSDGIPMGQGINFEYQNHMDLNDGNYLFYGLDFGLDAYMPFGMVEGQSDVLSGYIALEGGYRYFSSKHLMVDITAGVGGNYKYNLDDKSSKMGINLNVGVGVSTVF